MARGAFRPWLEERVLADDADLLVVDKPSGIPVHGGDERLSSDAVGRLAAYLEESTRDPYLGVHQRLDLGTSGVLVFVRRRPLNAVVARDFEGGAVRKRYVAAVEIDPRSPLARRSSIELEQRVVPDGARMRVSERGGRLCRAECRVLQRSGQRALVLLVPHTGRTHQLRVQLAAISAPIAGDRDYGGAPAPRLLLHAHSLFLPSLGRRFESAVPAVFERWIQGASEALGSTSEMRQRLRDAACKRHPLLGENSALRWVNGWGDELPGVVVDWYDGHTTLAVASDEAIDRHAELATLLQELGAHSVYLKVRRRADLRHVDRAAAAPGAPLSIGQAPEPLVVREGPLQLGVRLDDGLSTGLFIDQRDNRRRIYEASPGSSVLNLFAYTGAFSVAAARGGARQVTSVDVSHRALSRAEHNFRLNGIDPTGHRFVREDVSRYLSRALSRGERFDWIVLDPPSFASSSGSGKQVFRAERDYGPLLKLALSLLAPRGRLLAVTNHRKTSRAALRKLVLGAARQAGRSVLQVKELGSGLDCPDGPSGPEPSKAVLCTLS